MTKDELTLLLALNGNMRIVHMEEEIFADEKLAILYLQAMTCYRLQAMAQDYEIAHLINNYKWDGEMIAWAIYHYALLVINGRWLVAEHLMQGVTEWKFACNYYKKYNNEFGTQL